jgi:RNA polymerase sigma factor for flagellar operon FliA
VHQSSRRITRVTSNLAEELEREPTQEELARALGLEESDFIAFQTHAQPRQVVSLDEITENRRGGDNLSLGERLSDPLAARPDEALHFAEACRGVRRLLARLPKTQATVIVLHYLQNVPLRTVAQVLTLTPSRVSQLHHQALGRLRELWRLSSDATA